jgi:queuine tRNA-ribosyltransferase
MTDRFSYEIVKKGPTPLARAGVIHTPHGGIQTPAFLVVGTQATVKGVSMPELAPIRPEGLLANAYHLYLDPGHELVAKAGGVAKYMGWNGPTMTDSGGFQVFSLGSAFGNSVSKIAKAGAPVAEIKNAGAFVKIDEEGVDFTSHRDGSKHRFTPERSMEIQRAIGADIIVAFDECTSPTEKEEYQKAAMDRTHRWAKRCVEAHAKGGTKGKQALYGVVQGGQYKHLREESARTLGAMDFEGYAIGGSFTKEDIATAVGWVDAILPEDKPRHLLGIGEPEDIFLGVEQGIDTFDCVIPTRMGRHGQVFTKTGKKNLNNSKFRELLEPIEKDCGCYTCSFATTAYLSHLFRTGESLAGTLASIHNIHFLVSLVRNIRTALLNDTFVEYKKDFLRVYLGSDQ